jgi:uncharacterized protein
MLTIYVDADSCPVKDEVMRVALRHDLEVYLVSNSWLVMAASPKVHRILVEKGADMADNWIAEHIGAGDVVITADILLADRCLKNKAEVVSPTGKLFTEDNIGMAIAMRGLSAHLRETGEVFGHHHSFSRQDKSRFLQALEEVIQQVKRR